MSAVPHTPAEFFESYAPAHVARLGSAIADRTSPGAVAFEIPATGAWSLRLTNGRVTVTPGVAPDTLVRITLTPEAFAEVVVAGAERLPDTAPPDHQLVAIRALTLDADRARLLRDSAGSLLMKLTSPSGDRRLTLTLGGAEPKLDTPDAELTCALEDLWSIQSGAKNPFELLMEGKLSIGGNMQIAMALGAALGS
jgi:hypothetical protein